ncbi:MULTISPECIES: NmrA/HSCARG family protein [Streptomyces]|uniref:NmrA/HSCARG family protein n=1 Tax=Streptomyces TaxID=1883 RepID=UPI000F559507|nr:MULTISPECIES: NmrA/HSCARG family protein [unclassified Streptomyces]MBL3806060.1 NmrA/HSCARG family protein [Streptomyces sp. BRB081]NEE34898.1 NmrA/HSCARG family protein [Streptomyces sp. SID7982]NEE59279.1 NmrA/HSCARG family protein [Streptomyces sp. SID8455]RPK91070.1 Quinone oxidoreductase 2 [Streptomyces sp. ADI98-12]
MTIAVLGATGGQGGAVTAALLRTGHQVRAMVRDPGSVRAQVLAGAGVSLVEGDLTDVEALTTLFRSTRAAFAVTTPFQDGLEAEKEQGAAVVRAAERAGLPHLVLSSVAGADQHTGVPHFETKAHTERLLAVADVPSTVVAPTYFYENALGPGGGIAAGSVALPLGPETRLQQVARHDLGHVVAAIVAAPDAWAGERIELAGDDPTGPQMAAAIGAATGRELEFRSTSLEAVREADPDMGAMWGFLAEHGYDVDIPALHARFPGVPWTTYADWAAAQHWPEGR